jgi:hypothetical protein
MRSKAIELTVVAVLAGLPTSAVCEDHGCPVAHTHIGVNPTWRPADWSRPDDGAVDLDPTDDNKLWFFSLPPVHACATPGWPNWQQVDGSAFLVLTPVLEEDEHIAKPGDPHKELFTCSFTYSKAEGYSDPCGLQHLDGWHSAHGPQGAWDLDSVDANTVPAWDLYLRRERVSPNLGEDDFFTLLHDDTPALASNGDTHQLPRSWLVDKNAWGLHEHMGFYFWLDEEDEGVHVVLSVHDMGGVYERSADFVMRFAREVCQPVPGDVNGDCGVDFADFALMLDSWLASGVHHGADQVPHDHDHP